MFAHFTEAQNPCNFVPFSTVSIYEVQISKSLGISWTSKTGVTSTQKFEIIVFADCSVTVVLFCTFLVVYTFEMENSASAWKIQRSCTNCQKCLP